VRVTTISLGIVTGHASAGGGFFADVDFLNREISDFSTFGDRPRRETEIGAGVDVMEPARKYKV
jgi:hypothetical protein